MTAAAAKLRRSEHQAAVILDGSVATDVVALFFSFKVMMLNLITWIETL